MARSFRVFYHDQQGRGAKNFNIGGFDITNSSAVLVTAALYNRPASGPDVNTRLLVHGPDAWVSNVVPHGGPQENSGVEFMLHVDSDHPVDVAVTITLLEHCEGSSVV
jgi:hypothetical protein